MKINIPVDALTVIKTLKKAGFEAYAVGGCVRDSVMGRTPADWDVCTSAEPKQVKEVFSTCKVIDTGISHGTVTLILDEINIEVTTFRCDGDYVLHRKPERVRFVKSLAEDLSRRDFTMNAICCDGENITDLVGGIKDIEQKTVRAVGDPDKRFKEDALRILRAIRFCSVLGFSLEKETEKSAYKNRWDLKFVSKERIRDELLKLLCGQNVCNVLIKYRDIIAVVLPEIRAMFDFEQNTPYHYLDVWQHTVKSVGEIKSDPILRLTMLLHDVGKPHVLKVDRTGRAHFKTHPQMSVKLARGILARLKLSNDDSNRVLILIKEHDNRIEQSDRAMRRFLSNHSFDREFFESYMAVRFADANAQSDYKREQRISALVKLKDVGEEFLNSASAVSAKDLLINGNDLLSLGFKGKQIGDTLNALAQAVCAGEIQNDREELLSFVKEHK